MELLPRELFVECEEQHWLGQGVRISMESGLEKYLQNGSVISASPCSPGMEPTLNFTFVGHCLYKINFLTSAKKL